MISQGRISDSIGGFPFLKQWGIGPYKDPNKPAIFIGCYNPPEDFRLIMSHKALGVLIWGGTDADVISAEKLRKIKAKTNIKHIALGGFIARDLSKAGIPYVRIPLTIASRVMEPYPLGDKVYCYTPPKTNRSPYRYYGGHILEEVMRMMPRQKFILATPKLYSREKLFELYKECFIGLRLTVHDGFPNTVAELGLRGRRCVFNDNVPTALSWTDARSVVKIIENEKRLTPGPQKVAQDMYDYLDISYDFLEEDYWSI